jgi:hypothetical protein
VPAQIAAAFDIRAFPAFRDRVLHGRRRAGLQHLEYDASGRGADVRNLAEGAVGLQQRFERLLERQNRRGRALVPPHALLRLLNRGQIPQQRGDLPVDIRS